VILFQTKVANTHNLQTPFLLQIESTNKHEQGEKDEEKQEKTIRKNIGKNNKKKDSKKNKN
jgi:hypothetical protein